MNIAEFLKAGLGGIGRGLKAGADGLGRVSQFVGDRAFTMDPNQNVDPTQQNALRRQGMMQLGLGMLGGQPAFQAMQGAQANVQGAMQNAYDNATRNRQEARQTERDKLADERYAAEREHALQRESAADARYQSERDYQTKRDQWDQQFKDRQLATEASLKRDALNAKGEPNVRDIDRLRREYDTRKQKVVSGGQQAEQILQLAANPNIANDPSAQTALVYSFGRMLDPESVVREGEYQIMERSRGLLEQVSNIIPKLQTGARLTPEQIQRMAQVAQQFAGRDRERAAELGKYYGELATRRGIDPFEVTGQSYRPEAPQADPNVIDVGANSRPPAAAPQGGLGRPFLQMTTDGRVVPVDY